MNRFHLISIQNLCARVRLNHSQRQDWHNAMRMNFSDREPATFADLRRFHQSIKSGAQFGRSSGYAP